MIRAEIIENYPEDYFYFIDGYDDAVIGVASRISMENVVAYSTRRIIEILVERDGMDEDEAQEFFDFNIIGAYIGIKTPIFIDI